MSSLLRSLSVLNTGSDTCSDRYCLPDIPVCSLFATQIFCRIDFASRLGLIHSLCIQRYCTCHILDLITIPVHCPLFNLSSALSRRLSIAPAAPGFHFAEFISRFNGLCSVYRSLKRFRFPEISMWFSIICSFRRFCFKGIYCTPIPVDQAYISILTYRQLFIEIV